MKHLAMIIVLFVFGFSTLFGQNSICFLDGPIEVFCQTDSVKYQITCPDSANLNSYNPNFHFVEYVQVLPENRATYSFDESSGVITINFEESGTYIIRVLIYTIDNRVSEIEKTVYVNKLDPLLEVEGCYEELGDCIAVCEGAKTVFRTQSRSGLVSEWEVIGAEGFDYIDNGYGIEVEWGYPGNGRVTVSDDCGDTTICVEILAEPEAEFAFDSSDAHDTLELCKGEPLILDNLSQNALSYEWSFGDGSGSQEFEPEHSYEQAGTYTVSLKTKGVCTCEDQAELIVVVLDAAAPLLDCIHTVCPDSRQVYTATTDGCSTFDWQVSNNGTIISGGASQDDFVEVIWGEGPDGIITLAVSDCQSEYCGKATSFRIPIMTEDGPIEGDQSVCPGELTTYVAPNFPGSSFEWTLNGAGRIIGPTDQYYVQVFWNQVSSRETAILSVEYEDCFIGCSGSDELTIDISPSIYLDAAHQVCQDQTAKASALAGFTTPSSVEVDWELIDDNGNTVKNQNSSENFQPVFDVAPGIYYWTAYNSSSDYCNEIIRQAIEVLPPPTPPLEIKGDSLICLGQEYGFSVVNDAEYRTSWRVTDGTSTFNYYGNSIKHQFGGNPPYLIEARNANLRIGGCFSAFTRLGLKEGIENEISGKDTVCLESIETYQNNYVNGATYEWEILPQENGQVRKSESNTVEVFWAKEGPATLQLTACGKTVTREIYVVPLPDFQILGDDSVCGNKSLLKSTTQPGLLHNWYDEDAVLISSSDSLALTPGNYSVELENGFGCVQRRAFHIQSLPFPDISISSPNPNPTCRDVLNGLELVSNTDNADYSFQWFQDNVPIGAGPTVFVSDTSRYFVEAVNEFGCLDRSNELFLFNCLDGANSGDGTDTCTSRNCLYLPYPFNYNNEAPYCNERIYGIENPSLQSGSGLWEIFSLNNIVHAEFSDTLEYKYEYPGYYAVRVYGELTGYNYVSPICGHYSYFLDTVKLVADFLSQPVCAGSSMVFNDLSTTLPDEEISSWTWNFGDPSSGANNTSTNQNPQHVFTDAGTYNVQLTAMTRSGCNAVITKEVIVFPEPDLSPEYDDLGCELNATAFELSNTELFEILWDFDDPGSQNNQAESRQVMHTYTNQGNYQVTVEASDVYGCISREQLDLEIKQNDLMSDIIVSPGTEVCEGAVVQLRASGNADQWLWNTGDTTNQLRVEQSGLYSVFLKDEYGCTFEPAPRSITVESAPVALLQGRRLFPDGTFGLWQDSLVLCEGEMFELQAFAVSGNLDFMWNNGEEQANVVFDGVELDLPSPGRQVYSVTVTSGVNGCSSMPFRFEVLIHESPDAPQILLASGSGCAFDQNELEVVDPQPDIRYLWSDGQEGASIIAQKQGEYFVRAFSPEGCETVSNVVDIRPSANINALPAGCFDLCQPHELCLPALDNVSNYILYRDGIAVDQGNSWPENITLTEDGSYTFELSSNNGCSVISDPLDVDLHPGFGNITIEVYQDLDGDGMISAADTLLPGIAVQLSNITVGGLLRSALTRGDGAYEFTDLPGLASYLGALDTASLNPRWLPVIGQAEVDIAECNETIVLQLLVEENCLVAGAELEFDVCPGEEYIYLDSNWVSPGSYEYAFLSETGCDSTVSVLLTAPDSVLYALEIWIDIDRSGDLSAADTLLPGINILLSDVVTGTSSLIQGISGGSGLIENKYGDHILTIDPSSLPTGTNILIDSLNVTEQDCDTVDLSFLIGIDCPTAILVENIEFCEGDSVELYGEWFSAAGTDTLRINRSVSFCDTTLIMTIYVKPNTLQADPTTVVICEGNESIGQIYWNASGREPLTYQWDPEVSTGSSAQGLMPGAYSITITDPLGCRLERSVTLNPIDTLDFDILPRDTVLEGEMKQLFITGDTNVAQVSVNWMPERNLDCYDCFDPVFEAGSSIIYDIELLDPNDCVHKLTKEIVVITKEDQLWVPNAFSPNNDDINDRFKLYVSNPESKLESFQIFNRWGEILYEEEGGLVETMAGWDGMFKGKALNPGVFVYTALLELPNGEMVEKQGDVTLVR